MPSVTPENELNRDRALMELARRMSRAAASEIPREQLDDLQPAIDQLVELGALLLQHGSVRFFHESLRDFVAARAFVTAGGSLADEVVAGGQDLSRRGVVRQVLTYQRGLNRDAYTSNVTELLKRRDIRFHMRDAVFDVLRSDPEPTPEDWTVIEPLLVDETHRDHRAAWSVVVQAAWFRLGDRLGKVIAWLAGEDLPARNRATHLVRVVQREDPERVAVLLSPFHEMGGDWPQRILSVVTNLGVAPGPRYLALLSECVDRGLFDNGHAFEADALWIAAHELPSVEPSGAVELLRHYLARGRRLAGGLNPFSGEVFPRSDYWAKGFLAATARHRPRGIVDAALPLVLEVADASADEREQGDETRTGDPWEYRWRVNHDEFHWILYDALDDALRRLARSRPASLRVVARSLLEVADVESVRYLLFRAWSSNPGQFSDDALRLLLSSPSPFRCASETSPYGATRELIASVQDTAPLPQLHELESRIAAYVPGWERTPAGRSQHRLAQWQLLEAFDQARLSPGGRALLRELRDKFGTQVPDTPPIRTGVVGPPIPAVAARRMTNAQWRSAINKYDSDDMRTTGATFTGGAIEQARVLEAEVTADPNRFAEFATTLEAQAHPAYVDAILRGIGDADAIVNPTLFFNALRHFFNMPAHPGGRWIARAVGRIADRDVPLDILDIVAWYATEDPDPEGDAWLAKRNQASSRAPEAALTAGINSVRGVAAEALGTLLWADAERIPYLSSAIEQVCDDQTLAVRACAALVVSSVLRHDETFGLRLFHRLTNARDELLASRLVEQLIGAVVRTSYSDAKPLVHRMLESQDPEVREAGGRLAAWGALLHPAGVATADLALSGDVQNRVGVGQVAAANVASTTWQQQCSRWLEQLFLADEEPVRDAASGWCRSVDSDQLGALRELTEIYLDSPAYADDEQPLLWALDDSDAPVADLGLLAVEHFLDRRGDEIGNIATRAAGAAMTADMA